MTAKGADVEEELLPVASASAGSSKIARSVYTARLFRLADRSLGVVGIVVFFLAWEIASRTHILNPFYFPPFSQVVAKGIELFASGAIWAHMVFSLTNFRSEERRVGKECRL